jgi:hypothetical protein
MSYKILDIRGTHGSGKSFIPLSLLAKYEHREIISKPITYAGPVGIVGYHIPELNLYILGKYTTACGGCDGIKTQDEIRARVNVFSQCGHVLLEGILVAHTFGPWLEFSAGRNWIFMINDTPLPECIRRVNARREARGQGPLLDPVNIIRDHKTTTGLYDKFLSAGRQVRWLKHLGDPVVQVEVELKS